MKYFLVVLCSFAVLCQICIGGDDSSSQEEGPDNALKELQKNVSSLWTHVSGMQKRVEHDLHQLHQHQMEVTKTLKSMFGIDLDKGDGHMHHMDQEEHQHPQGGDHHHKEGHHDDDHHSHEHHDDHHSNGHHDHHSNGHHNDHHSHGHHDHHDEHHHDHHDEHHHRDNHDDDIHHGDDHHGDSHGSHQAHHSEEHHHHDNEATRHDDGHQESHDAGHNHQHESKVDSHNHHGHEHESKVDSHDHHCHEHDHNNTGDSDKSENHQQEHSSDDDHHKHEGHDHHSTDHESNDTTHTAESHHQQHHHQESHHGSHHHHQEDHHQHNHYSHHHSHHASQKHSSKYDFAVCIVEPNTAIPPEKQQNITGRINLWQKKNGTKLHIHIKIKGFNVDEHDDHGDQHPGEDQSPVKHTHGFHIHQNGDLSDSCQSTGPHYNPTGVQHGGPSSPIRHVGDLGNIKCDQHGVTNVVLTDEIASLSGEDSIIGKSMVIHERNDDLGTNPDNPASLSSGDAGTRIACCIIRRVDRLPKGHVQGHSHGHQHH